MRLLLDENLPIMTVKFLRELGHDVVGVHDESLVSQADEFIFAHARQSERVLVTYNADFIDLRALAGVHHSGIIRLRISNQRPHFAHPILRTALEQLQDRDLADTLVTVSDQRIRVRHTSEP